MSFCEQLLLKLNSLTTFRNITNDNIFVVLNFLLENIVSKEKSFDNCLNIIKNYSVLCEILNNQTKNISLGEYINDKLLQDKNIFSTECANGNVSKISSVTISNTERDLNILNDIAKIEPQQIKDEIFNKYKDLSETFYFPEFCEKKIDIYNIDELSQFYEENGTEIFALNKFFRVNINGEIEKLSNFDDIKLEDLKLYNSQKEKANNNIKMFLENKPYANVLLYGDRGTGKSSCVKAIANEYKKLKIIQIDKNSLRFLPEIIIKLQDNPSKFLIFLDDLSFSENDDNFCILKAVLEGSLVKQPKNVVIYATTNRKHIVKETFSAREGNEIHLQDTIDEIMSLSDRFGLIITYTNPKKEEYLEIIRQILNVETLDNTNIIEEAEKFALIKGSRSPRTARQFLDYMTGKIKK